MQLQVKQGQAARVSDKERMEFKPCFFACLALLGHQAKMASFLTVIYDTHLGIEQGGIQKRVQQTPAAAVQAANDAEAAMAYCRDEVLPELASDMFMHVATDSRWANR